jgi:hypothetical protein
VETALLLPVVLILLLGAIDFGRLFFSWVTLHQAARIAANEASIDSSTESADVPTLVADEYAVMNCDPGPPTLVYTRAGAPVTNPEIGDYATVVLECDFTLLTPMSELLFGEISMRADSTFPIRMGCVSCEPGGPGPPPPPPPEECRTVPDMVGKSVAGARAAWTAAGFVGAFNTTASDTATVAPGPVIDPLAPECPSPQAIFNAEVTVTTELPQTEPAGCAVVPNLIGMTIADARAAWNDTPFGEVLPPEPDADATAIVASQDTERDGTSFSSEPGVTCLDPADEPPVDVEVTLGAPLPAPPPAPCQVPHLVDKAHSVGKAEWYAAGFAADTFNPSQAGWVIKSQSLAGFSWQVCDSSITVSQKEEGQP